MIPEDCRAEIVHTGISFMRSITEAYGAEEGQKLWDTIANTLDPDIKGQIFFAMLTGNFSHKVVLLGYTEGGKIPAIKAIRTVTGLGLKEAKDIADQLDYGIKPVSITLSDPTKRNVAVSILREAGVRL
jgi:hypothetical protein